MWLTSFASPGTHRRVSTIIIGAGVVAIGGLVVGVGSTAPGLRAQPSAVTQPPAVTFTSDIAPILFRRCVGCHQDGGAAPFSLLSYTAARQRAAQIAEVTRRRYMPPWKPDPEGSGNFVDSPRLTEDEIARIDRWVRDGAPEGDPARIPPAPVLAAGWKLGTPDLIVSLAQGFEAPADGTDVFRIFVVPVPTTRLRYVKGLEFHPGSRVVHHANIRTDPTAASRQFDEGDPAPGYDGLIARTAVYPDGHFLGWTPGQVAPLLPKGLAWRLAPGTDLVVELHLQPTGKRETVIPEIGLYFGDDPPEQTPAMLRLGKQDIDIPAGAASYSVHDTYELPVDVTLQAVQAHAHYRARSVRATATSPDGSVTPILSISDWDFRWQDVYRLASPVSLPKGTTLSMNIVYDNSPDNPRNPVQPPRRVYWGQRSADEMGDVWFQVLTRDERDLTRLNEAFRPKVLAEDVIGYEREITRDPTNVALRDSAALLYLELGNRVKTLDHFAESARLRPDSAAAHFNLGTAQSLNGHLAEAEASFVSALALRPDYPQAHNNLGSLLLQRGDRRAAAEHFREALRLDPLAAEAHRNLAVIHRDSGNPAAAITELRQVLTLRPDWPAAMADLAWLLATTSQAQLRDPARALGLAERAAALTGRRDASTLDVLAAAHAAAGDFERAIEVAELALPLATSAAAGEAIRGRIALYRGRTPVVEP